MQPHFIIVFKNKFQWSKEDPIWIRFGPPTLDLKTFVWLMIFHSQNENPLGSVGFWNTCKNEITYLHQFAEIVTNDYMKIYNLSKKWCFIVLIDKCDYKSLSNYYNHLESIPNWQELRSQNVQIIHIREK